MLKLGLVGCGNISQAHLDAWQHVPEVKLVAVCDIRPEKATAAAEATGAKAYVDFDQMLSQAALDILDICTPTYLHPDFAVKALNQGIHVLTEKPISLHEADVNRVYGAAKAQGVRFMVAQVLRFWPAYQALKAAFDTGKFGKLLSGSMTRLGNTPKWSWDSWMTDPARSGLVPFDLHIHDLDFMIHAFGKPKDTACFRSRNAKQDYIHAIYHYDGFFIAAEAAWFDCTYRFRASYRFHFERAVMEYADQTLTIYRQDNTSEALPDQAAQAQGVGVPGTNAYYNEIRYFTDCVLSGRDCEMVKPEELVSVLSIIAKLDAHTHPNL